MKITPKEFLEDYNYQCNDAEEQTDEVLFELKHLLINMFEQYCDEVPNFEFINRKGQIRLIVEQ